jgi:hypothetical protein
MAFREKGFYRVLGLYAMSDKRYYVKSGQPPASARWAKERAQSKDLREDAEKLLAQARKRQGEIAKKRGL